MRETREIGNVVSIPDDGLQEMQFLPQRKLAAKKSGYSNQLQPLD